jgi:hypothetical protein
MPADPRPRAPLAVMDDEKLADAQDLASQATDEVDTFAVQIALCDALVECDAQREARATAYAEGLAKRIEFHRKQQAMNAWPSGNDGAHDHHERIADALEEELKALRDTPATPRHRGRRSRPMSEPTPDPMPEVYKAAVREGADDYDTRWLLHLTVENERLRAQLATARRAALEEAIREVTEMYALPVDCGLIGTVIEKLEALRDAAPPAPDDEGVRR